MKKLLFVFAIAAAFAACNDSATTEAPKADTTAPVQTAPDTTVLKADTSALKADTTVKADTTKPAAH